MENNVRKGEIACNKQFLLFSQCFLPYVTYIFLFQMHFKMSSAISFNFSSGNGLMFYFFHSASTESLNELFVFERVGIKIGNGRNCCYKYFPFDSRLSLCVDFNRGPCSKATLVYLIYNFFFF